MSTLRHLALLSVAAGALTASGVAARPDSPGSDLFTFDVGDVIETFDTEHFRLHYTRDGVHKVPAADTDADGVPDHVQRLSVIYEEALTTYTDMGFRAPISDDGLPDNGGDGRFDVYLVDFARQADGAYRAERCDGVQCSGYMVQENDFAGYGYPSVDVGNRTVASHELFHAVQAAYHVDQGSVFAEGTAVWASERYDESLRDLEGFAYGYLDEAATPLDTTVTGPVDAFTYGSGIFFEYLSERYDDDQVRLLWEAVDPSGPDGEDVFWFDQLPALFEDLDTTFADAFAEFSTWTLYTDDDADPSVAFATGSQMDPRPGLDRTLPVHEASFVLFRASSRLLRFSTSGRTSLRVVVGGVGSATAGVRAYLFADGVLTEIEGLDAEVPVSGNTEAELLLVNTNDAGSSARPQVCVGSGDEVAPCLPGGEGEGEGEDDEDDDDDEDQSLGGGGCQSATPTLSGAMALLAFTLRRRRRVWS